MKLLLTSAGFTNNAISNALGDLLNKPFSRTNLVFIPTAANIEEGGKEWLIDDLSNCKKLGFKLIDIIDISALPKDVWEKRLKDADVLLFGGGDTYHLMYWLKKSGLDKMLPKLLEKRVYVGISAGSMVTTKDLSLSTSNKLYSEKVGKIDIKKGLGFIDFQIRPHLNSQHFPKVREKNLRAIAKNITDTIYAIDDDTAIKVNREDVKVISEGKWEKYD